MSVDVSALGSIQSSLDEVLERLGEQTYGLGDDDEIGSELREVQRQLATASRRLEKAQRRARS